MGQNWLIPTEMHEKRVDTVGRDGGFANHMLSSYEHGSFRLFVRARA